MTTSDLKRSIGKRVHDFRLQNNYTQAQFAELIDISVNFLSEIENGKKGMSQDTICKLCTHFHLSADFILLGKSSPEDETGSLINLANNLDCNELGLVIDYLTSLKKVKERNL